jgi:hypothetical protein
MALVSQNRARFWRYQKQEMVTLCITTMDGRVGKHFLREDRAAK